MSNDKQATVMTPVFEGTRYQHHVCSECGGTLKFEQSVYGGVCFYAIHGTKCDKIKFCPICGAEIIRFSDKAIYEKPIDLKPLDIFAELHLEYERKARWLYYCYISEAHREKIRALMPLLESGEITVFYKDALKLAKIGSKTYSKLSATTLRKMRKEFGEDTE